MSEKADNCHSPLSVSVSPPQPLCHILVLSCFPALCGYVCVYLGVLVFCSGGNQWIFLPFWFHTPSGNHTPACDHLVKSHYLRQCVSFCLRCINE